MLQLLGQTLEAGRALRCYLHSRRAQSQLPGFASADMHHVSAITGQAGRQSEESSSLSPALVADVETGTPVSRQGRGVTDQEASAAFDLHSTMVCNLAARLSLSAHVLYGVILTEPWEVLEAFKQ